MVKQVGKMAILGIYNVIEVGATDTESGAVLRDHRVDSFTTFEEAWRRAHALEQLASQAGSKCKYKVVAEKYR